MMNVSDLPEYHITKSTQISLKPKITENRLFNITLQVTAPTGYSMPGFTPIVINLAVLADVFPSSADPFGTNTPESSDDIKWNAAYVTYGGLLIPSQVDDLDDIRGFSEDDELVFALPESVNLASGETASFSVYFSLKDMDLPPPYFPEVCTISIYPDLRLIDAEWPYIIGKGDGIYDLENGLLRVSVLKAAAWSTGAVYHIQLLDEQGESRWDIVKQKFPYPSEIWKWSRFALIDQFAAQNQYADRPYPGKVVKMIPGPVRARFTVQSTQPYVSGAFLGGTTTINDLFGLFTYEIYANQTYLDYTLELTGPKADDYPEIALELQNREWGGGRPGTLYKGIYIPGKGWVERAPDDPNLQKVEKGEFIDSWYLEALLEGDTVRPDMLSEPNEDPYRGYGFIFDDTGFANITWTAASESLSSWYSAAQFPLQARYHPFDKIVLKGQDKIQFMEDRYEEYLRPPPTFNFSSSIISLTEIPFTNLFVSTPETSLDFDNNLLQVENITAFATNVAEFVNDASATSATYKLLNFNDKSETEISGDLTWNDTSQTWEAKDLDVSSLNLSDSFVIIAEIETSTLGGRSPPSERFGGGADIYPPIITAIIQTPMATQIIRSTDIVKISCLVTDESGVSSVILSYHNGSWYDVPMVFEYGLFTGSIPPHPPGKMIQYRITATDNSVRKNYNTTKIFNYVVKTEITTTTTTISTTTTPTPTITPSWDSFLLLLSLFAILSWRQRKKKS